MKGILKVARISSAEEKARARKYYRENKATIARKKKIRRRKIKSGVHRPRKRTGSASTGYNFVMQAPQTGQSGSSTGKDPRTGGSSVNMNFQPDKRVGTTARQSKLKPL